MAGEKIALGFGGNVDYEIEWDSALFGRLAEQYQIREDELSCAAEVRDIRTLLLSVMGFMRSGSGGEVFPAEAEIITDFAKLFKYRITVGGTNVRAAICLAKIGKTSRLHVLEKNEHLVRLLPREGTKIWGGEDERFYPHLIVQFDRGAEIHTSALRLRAERANRIIYAHNPRRLEMRINPAFFEGAGDVEALLVSGFNSVHSGEILAERAEELAAGVARLSPGVRVVFEDGGYHRPGFNTLIQKALGDKLEVYSLNEDELQKHLGVKVNLLESGEIASLLPRLKEIIPVSVLVLHTKYWALAYGKGAEKYRRCLLGGINLATTRLRYGDDIDMEKYRETSLLEKDVLGAEFAGKINKLAGNMVCCEPSLDVRETKVTTIGLGDAFAGGFIAEMTSR